MTTKEISMYEKIGREIGNLVTTKQTQYGDSFGKSEQIFQILYPDGVKPENLRDFLAIVRVVDKLFRVAQRGPDRRDLGGESPWRDIVGYGLLALAQDHKEQNIDD